MPTMTPDNGSQRPKAEVLLLDQYDKRLLSASFLNQVASGLFLCTLIFASMVMFAALSTDKFRGLDTAAFLQLAGVIFLILAILFVWSCAIARMWRAPSLLLP